MKKCFTYPDGALWYLSYIMTDVRKFSYVFRRQITNNPLPHLWGEAGHKEILTYPCPRVDPKETLHLEGVLCCPYQQRKNANENLKRKADLSVPSRLLATVPTQWYLPTKWKNPAWTISVQLNTGFLQAKATREGRLDLLSGTLPYTAVFNFCNIPYGKPVNRSISFPWFWEPLK